jgi:hypothetical protein
MISIFINVFVAVKINITHLSPPPPLPLGRFFCAWSGKTESGGGFGDGVKAGDLVFSHCDPRTGIYTNFHKLAPLRHYIQVLDTRYNGGAVLIYPDEHSCIRLYNCIRTLQSFLNQNRCDDILLELFLELGRI